MSGVPAAMSPRSPRPELRLDVWGAVTATLLAWLAYFVARSIEVLPGPGYGVVLFAIAPTCAAAAAIVLWARAYAEADPALSWMAAGVAVSFVAMLLHLVSLPAISPHGGPLHTSTTGATLLYLLFHWTLALGALAGTWRPPLRWRPAAVAVGVLVAVVFALDLVPTPELMGDDETLTGIGSGVEYATGALAFAAMFVWVLRSGRLAPALHGWVAVALAFNAYDPLLHALAGRRYDPEWWASMAMRVATYAVLALAAAITVLLQLRRHEQYAEAELTRRESELLAALRATSQLLASSESLTSAAGETDVARVTAAAASAGTGSPRALVEILDESYGGLRLLASVGLSEAAEAQLTWVEPERRLPGPHVLRGDQPVYTSHQDETRRLFGDLPALPGLQDTAAVAALPLRLATGRVGVLVVSDDQERRWTDQERQLLAGLADQAAQALQRAHLFERERATAEALQRGMLPEQLGGTAGVQVAARYVPGAQGMTVGGDWYDSIPLPDGRNVLVVGDVMGKGAVAAAVMGRARSVVRALVAVDPRPALVLEGLDKVTSELTPDGFITVLYVLLDPAREVADVGRAGHLPLLLATPDGTVRLRADGGSPAIGIRAPARRSARISVPVGSTLALFTDGLVEDRVTGLDRGLRRVCETFREYRDAGLGELADQLLTLDAGASEYDDVCLLLARMTPLPVTPATAAAPAAGGRDDNGPGDDAPRPNHGARRRGQPDRRVRKPGGQVNHHGRPSLRRPGVAEGAAPAGQSGLGAVERRERALHGPH